MVIQHNISALNSWRNTRINNNGVSKNLEKLASGFKINRSADDAAGLGISEKMRGQIRGLNMAKMNIEHGINFVKTADGGIAEITDTLQRIREISVQMTNGTYTDEDRALAQLEVDQLYKNIDMIANTTHFNGIYMLNGGTISKEIDSINLKLTPNSILPTSQSITAFGQEVNFNYTFDGKKITFEAEIDSAIVDSVSHTLVTAFNEVYGSSQNEGWEFGGICFKQTSDGGFLLVTHTMGSDGDWLDNDGKDGAINVDGQSVAPAVTNQIVLKLDKFGKKEWSTLIANSGGIYPKSDTFSELPNGNYAIVSNGAIVTLNKDGDFVSSYAVPNSIYNSPLSIYTEGNNLVVISSSSVVGTPTLSAQIMDFNGNIISNKQSSISAWGIDLTGYNVDAYFRTFQACEDGYIITGKNSNNASLWIAKVDKNLNPIYVNSYNATAGSNPEATSVIETEDGGVIMVGSFRNTLYCNTATLTSVGYAGFAVKYDKFGNEVWAKSYDTNANSKIGSIVNNGDGTFTVGGSTTNSTKPWIFQIDGNSGELISEKILNSSGIAWINTMGSDGNGLTWYAGCTHSVGGDIGNSESTIKGSPNIWVFSELTPRDFHIGLDLGSHVLEVDESGDPLKWIEYEVCDSSFSSDGTTLKELNVKVKLLRATLDGDIILQVGANSPDTFTIQKSDMRTKTLFNGMKISVNPREAANATVGYIDKVINHVNTERAKFGAYQNALEHIKQNVMAGAENLQAAESTIRDVDMAKEMMDFTKSNILVQAAQSMLAQANQLPQGVLSLLQ